MPYNAELFGKVYDQITNTPRNHEQSEWEYHGNSCGTTRCVGGWALHFTHPDVEDLLDAAALILDVPASDASLSEAARKVLGLSAEEADDLLYDCDNGQAVELCAYYAGYRADKVDIHA